MRPEFKLSERFVKEVIGVTLGLEGGIVDNPHDKGGLTKFGISTRYYPEARQEGFTPLDAIEIYKRIALESKTVNIVAATQNYKVGAAFFAFAVHMGPDDAIPLLQTVLRRFGQEIKIDGQYGPKTQAALVQVNSQVRDLDLHLLSAMSGYYARHAIAVSQRRFLQGWINRVGRNFVDYSKPAEVDRQIAQAFSLSQEMQNRKSA